MINLIRRRFAGKSIVLLGFGREGQSTYLLLRKVFPDKLIAIADLNDGIRDNPLLTGDNCLEFITGEGYLQKTCTFDYIFRSPGIPVWNLNSSGSDLYAVKPDENGVSLNPGSQFTSQTELFLEFYSKQVIGVTGTKGKSTTSSLIHHILKTAGRDALLVGNIGNPVFHFIDLITPETVIVFELSSHQLEFLKRAPNISVLLNLYQEHLDAYESYEAYQLAKINITKFQKHGDYLVFNADDRLVEQLVAPYLQQRQGFPFSLNGRLSRGGFIEHGDVCFSDGIKTTPVWKVHQDRFLRGEHNLKNILAAVNVAMISGINTEDIEDGIATFKGLEHRLEYVGEFRGIHFYNDSIATIPEACMEAVKAIPNVDTLVAGGFDRGIDYSGLGAFLSNSSISNILLVGTAGKRIMKCIELHGINGKNVVHLNHFDEFQPIAFQVTRKGYACLLSPAAASYDEFKNFEERGIRFRRLVKGDSA
jgi:UDP-N-acetylmuramoylalanine--D-glutamate ligase